MRRLVKGLLQRVENFLIPPASNPLPKEVKDKLRDEGKGVPFQ